MRCKLKNFVTILILISININTISKTAVKVRREAVFPSYTFCSELCRSCNSQIVETNHYFLLNIFYLGCQVVSYTASWFTTSLYRSFLIAANFLSGSILCSTSVLGDGFPSAIVSHTFNPSIFRLMLVTSPPAK